MRGIALILGIFSLFSGKGQEHKFTLSGSFSGFSPVPEKLVLEFSFGDKRVSDTAMVSNGNYQFSGEVPIPVLADLVIIPLKIGPRQRLVSTRLFIGPGVMQVMHIDSFPDPTVNGSIAHTDFRFLEVQSKPYKIRMARLYDDNYLAKKRGDTKEMEFTGRQIEAVDLEMRNRVYGAFVRLKPFSPVAVYALQQFAGDDMLDVGRVEPLFNSLSAGQQASAGGLEIAGRMAAAKKTDIGQQAVDFTLPDTNGRPVSLSSFRGKFLLIDFWASWCGPCRLENPNLLRAYKIFAPKGFEVLGVAFERLEDKYKWLDAIREDQLTWTNVSDLSFWDNAAGRLYGIAAIPQNLLLDPGGKIIAKNLWGNELVKKLEGIYGQ